VTVQVRTGKGAWQRTGTVRLGAGGAYAIQVPHAGVYRAVYRGLDGPSAIVP
jgi:hypothetical protein